MLAQAGRMWMVGATVLGVWLFCGSRAVAQGCESLTTLNSEWIANIQAFDESKSKLASQRGEALIADRCRHAKMHVEYLRNARAMITKFERANCPGKWEEIKCDSSCFNARIPAAEATVARVCGAIDLTKARACAAAIDRYNNGHKALFDELQRRVRKEVDLIHSDKSALADKEQCSRWTWYWSNYLPFLQRELRGMEDACGSELFDYFDKATYRDSAYFQGTQVTDAREKLRKCGLAADESKLYKPSAPTKTVSPSEAPSQSPSKNLSCASTITGGNLPPAPKEQCDKAKKWTSEARAARKSWFGGKQKAEPLYKQAAQVYKEAGDLRRAELVNEESKADDVTVYERAERDAEQRPQNLKEARNLQDIARKIELGAYESKSCGDLQKAADYYFQAARYYMKANEFAATNALALRRDQLEAIVDDAKKRVACDGKVQVSRSPPSPDADPGVTQKLTDNQCRQLLRQLDLNDIRDSGEGAAQRIEVVPMCRGIVTVNQHDCLRASIHWYDALPVADIKSKLREAGCPVSG